MESDKNKINNPNKILYSGETARLGEEIAKTMDTDSHTCNDHLDYSVEEQCYPTFLFDGIKYKTTRISDSVEEGKKLGLNIKDPVTIYFLDGHGGLKQGAYRGKRNIIVIFSNADEITLKHEIIHSLERFKPVSDELKEFYETAKNIISEKSFDGSMVSFNFKKNIHEFIADGYSKGPFIDALKKEGLYEEFLEKTKYIFE